MMSLFHQAQAAGLGSSVCTLYEIHAGEDTTEEGQCTADSGLLSLEREDNIMYLFVLI